LILHLNLRSTWYFVLLMMQTMAWAGEGEGARDIGDRIGIQYRLNYGELSSRFGLRAEYRLRGYERHNRDYSESVSKSTGQKQAGSKKVADSGLPSPLPQKTYQIPTGQDRPKPGQEDVDNFEFQYQLGITQFELAGDPEKAAMDYEADLAQMAPETQDQYSMTGFMAALLRTWAQEGKAAMEQAEGGKAAKAEAKMPKTHGSVLTEEELLFPDLVGNHYSQEELEQILEEYSTPPKPSSVNTTSYGIRDVSDPSTTQSNPPPGFYTSPLTAPQAVLLLVRRVWLTYYMNALLYVYFQLGGGAHMTPVQMAMAAAWMQQGAALYSNTANLMAMNLVVLTMLNPQNSTAFLQYMSREVRLQFALVTGVILP
jgi:hypothetical protein